MKRVAVLGSTGMAGHTVALYLEERGYEVFRAARGEKNSEKNAAIDVLDFVTLGNWLDQVKPDVIINCVGILNKACDLRPDLSILINSYLPHWLEQKYSQSLNKVIHMSTDCVFSGARGSYSENDVPDGSTMYDRTKALGELLNNKDLTFRMSIIGPDINPDGIGLFNWFMRQQGQINGYGKAIWTGVTTIELARAMDVAIQKDVVGLYHLVPDNGIDKFSLLKLFKSAFDKNNVDIVRTEDVVIDKSLVNHRIDFDFTVRNYTSQVDDMKAWVVEHSSLYPHYDVK